MTVTANVAVVPLYVTVIVSVPAVSAVGVQVYPVVTSVAAPYSSVYVSTRPAVSSVSPAQYVVFVGAVLTASVGVSSALTVTSNVAVVPL